jgi:hypothetical protein
MSCSTSAPINKERNGPTMLVRKRYQMLESCSAVPSTAIGVVGRGSDNWAAINGPNKIHSATFWDPLAIAISGCDGTEFHLRARIEESGSALTSRKVAHGADFFHG